MPTSIKLSNLGILKAVTTCPACGYEHTLSAHTSIL